MPSNIRLNATLAADAAFRSESGPGPGALAAIMENAAQDFLLGPAIGGDKSLRWDPRDVCPECFTARASKTGACFCPGEDD